jgi:M penetrans paralogue family 26
MEEQQITPQNQQTLPNSVGVLVLGILSIVFCFCYGIIGMTLGIISLIMANKAIKLYLSSPETYSESSYKNVKAGKICAIVGLCLSSVYIIFLIIYIGIIGAAVGGGLLQGLGGGF